MRLKIKFLYIGNELHIVLISVNKLTIFIADLSDILEILYYSPL
jgi:hypothetical protein